MNPLVSVDVSQRPRVPPAVRARPVASFEFFAVCEVVRHSKVGA